MCNSIQLIDNTLFATYKVTWTNNFVFSHYSQKLQLPTHYTTLNFKLFYYDKSVKFLTIGNVVVKAIILFKCLRKMGASNANSKSQVLNGKQAALKSAVHF